MELGHLKFLQYASQKSLLILKLASHHMTKNHNKRPYDSVVDDVVEDFDFALGRVDGGENDAVALRVVNQVVVNADAVLAVAGGIVRTAALKR